MIGVRLDPVNGYVNFETPAVCRPILEEPLNG